MFALLDGFDLFMSLDVLKLLLKLLSQVFDEVDISGLQLVLSYFVTHVGRFDALGNTW